MIERPEDLLGGPDVIVVNSCAVTARAAAKSRQAARAAARKHPGSRVALVGCYPQVFRDEARQVEGVAGIAGTGRHCALSLFESILRGPRPAGNPDVTRQEPQEAPLDFPATFENLPAAPAAGRVRAFLKVQEGCQMNCAYCLVPQARGPQRSCLPEAALAAARSLLRHGARELVLTGIHLGAYGRDLAAGERPAATERPAAAERHIAGESLACLVTACLGLPGLVRLRLSSIEPTDIDEGLLRVLASDPRVCRHLHIPLQSGCDRTLAAMRRHYDTAGYAAVVRRARSALPGLAVSTDVMAGFPGETRADFDATDAFIREMGFMRLHVFPYSPRPNTVAATFGGQVPGKERERRARQLIATGRELAASYNRQLLGRETGVLLEKNPVPADIAGFPGYANEGLTPDYVRAAVSSTQPYPAGTLVMIRVTGADADGVTGQVSAQPS